MAALLADHVPAAASHPLAGVHHPGPHLAEDLRPGVRDDVRRPWLRHRHAEPLHVDRHLPAVPLRARRGDRDRAALDGRDPDRALPGVEPARRDRAMSILVSAAPRARSRFTPMRAGLYLLLVVLAVFYLTPVFAIIVTPLKGLAELPRSPVWELPKAADLSSYSTAFTALAPSFFNSVFLVVPATILSATLGSLNGYVLSKLRFRGANVVFTLLLFGMFIPYQSILIPLVQFLETINLYGGIPGLILVHVVYGIPICTLIFRNYFATVPRELLEAARIDGASVVGIYRHVMLPISVPGFVVVMIWQFTSIWNEFLFAVTIAQTPTQQPITVALQNLAGSLAPEQNIQMAGALMAALPTLLIYILLGRYFVRGLLAGSLKG